MEKAEVFLFNGQVKFKQNQSSAYRLSEDAAWLACAIDEPQAQLALELGLGTGALALCTYYRNPLLKITAVEKQPEMIKEAQKNISLNQAEITIVKKNIKAFKNEKLFDIAFANPPFYLPDINSLPEDDVKRIAHSFTDTTLTDWLNSLYNNTNDKGTFYLINHVMHLKEVKNWAKNKKIALSYIGLQTSATKGIKRFILKIEKGPDFSWENFTLEAYKEEIRQACLYQAQSLWPFVIKTD